MSFSQPTPRRGDRPVRLTQRERDGILRAVERVAHATGQRWRYVRLFGSRCDLDQRGGDIDLLVELEPKPVDIYEFRSKLAIALEDEVGEQKIDVVVDAGQDHQPFVELAREQGVELWTNA